MAIMNLEFQISVLQHTRKNVEKILSTYTIEQLNMIPDGFSNNLIWNYGHMIVTQQLLCYKLAGTDMMVSNELVELYRKGSRPEGNITEAEYSQLKELSKQTIQNLGLDYQKGLFTGYKEYPTSYGVVLRSIEDAIPFNNVHEGHHFGTILALRKFL